MKRTTILLEDDLALELAQVARAKKTTATAIIRAALHAYLTGRQASVMERFPFIAIGTAASPSHASERVDEILAAGIQRESG